MIYAKLGAPKESTGEGVLEEHLSAFPTKIKPCLEVPWGQSTAGRARELQSQNPRSALLCASPEDAQNQPGSPSTTGMDIPIQGCII